MTSLPDRFGARAVPREGGTVASLAMPLACLLLVSAGINLLALAAPVYSLQVFDRVLRNGHAETLVLLTLLLAAALAGYAVLEGMRGSQAARFGHLCESLLGRTRLAPFGAKGAGQRWAAVRAALAPLTLTRLCDLPWLPVFLLALWVIHPWLALLALAALALLAGLILLEHRVGGARLEGHRSEALLQAAGVDPLLTGQRAFTIRALARFDRLRAGEAEAGAGRLSLGQGLRGTATGIRLATQSGSLGLAAWLTIENQVTAGAIIAATILTGRCLGLAEQGCRALLTTREALPELRRLSDPTVRDLGAANPLPARSNDRGCQAALVLDNAVLRDPLTARGRTLRLNATIPMGAIVLVQGPVASGKSAVCELIAGLRMPDGGAIRLGGVTTASRCGGGDGGIAFLPQRPRFLPGPLLWSLAGEDDALRIAALDLADRLGLAAFVALLPAGWQTDIDADGAPLPAAMARLADMVQALATGPALLVADEPFAGLDPGTASRAAGLLRPVAGSHILVIAAADPRTLPLQPAVEISLLQDRARVETRPVARAADVLPRLGSFQVAAE